MAARNQAAFCRTIVTPTEALGRVRISELASRRASDGRVRWVAPQFGAGGFPHLTPTLSAPRVGEGDFKSDPSWTLGSCRNDGRGRP